VDFDGAINAVAQTANARAIAERSKRHIPVVGDRELAVGLNSHADDSSGVCRQGTLDAPRVEDRNRRVRHLSNGTDAERFRYRAGIQKNVPAVANADLTVRLHCDC